MNINFISKNKIIIYNIKKKKKFLKYFFIL